jgi:hypothetical protein
VCAHQEPFVVLGFASTRDALFAESTLEEADLEVVPVPAPRRFGPLCGIGLRLRPSDEVAALAELERVGIRVAARVETEDIEPL